MSNQKLKNQIIEWLQAQPYWLQYLGDGILEGAAVDDALVAQAYEYFKQDEGLAPVADRPAIAFNGAAAAEEDPDVTLKLVAIKNIANVNALAPEQTIKVGPNLTVVYGNNGSGKSGYVRLLNNAFPSRGDKVILPDVFGSNGNGGPPECHFTYQRTEDPYDLVFPTDKDRSEFSQYCVFDTKSVSAHLEKENSLSFTPSGFDFFEKLMAAHGAVKARLEAEIHNKSAPHGFLDLFQNDNPVRSLIETLGAETDLKEVEKLATMTEKDEAELLEKTTRLAELRTKDRAEQVRAIIAARNQLDKFCDAVTAAFEPLRAEKLEEARAAIEAVSTFEELAKAEGVESLDRYQIAEVGSDSWRAFIKAGRVYAKTIAAGRRGETYPIDQDNCLFCLQPLGDEETKLIDAYWNLLKSTAETELTKAKDALAKIRKKIDELPPLTFDIEYDVFKTVNKFDPELTERWMGLVKTYAETRAVALAAIDGIAAAKLPASLDAEVAEFDDCGKNLDDEKAALIVSNPSEETARLEAEIDLHNDRRILANIRDKVEAFVETAKWTARARGLHGKLSTAKITTIQGQLYDEHITQEYVDMFASECKRLDAPHFIKLAQRNQRGATLRKLKIANETAGKVLSEGEQRAISIADFITEAQLNPQCRGLIFDDPCSSQDHERRELIAERLAELAKSKQVIVFTHDIAMLVHLLHITKRESVQVSENYIWRTSSATGKVMPDLPWTAKSVNARVGVLKDQLVRLRKIEKEGDPNEYQYAVERWFMKLRQTWERAVEERLLKGVIERYSPEIQTKKLKYLEITDELIAEIDAGMTEASNWVHDGVPAENRVPPDTDKAQKALDNIVAFIAKCKAP